MDIKLAKAVVCVSPLRGVKHILEHVLLRGHDLVATDLEVSVIVSSGNGAMNGLIPTTLIKQVKGKTLDLTVSGDTITMGAFTQKVTHDPQDFPDVQGLPEGAVTVGTIPVKDLIRGLEVARVATTNSTRYALHGVLLEGQPGEGIRFVATDGKRMMVDGPYGFACTPLGFILPLGVTKIVKILEALKATGDVTLRVEKNRLEFSLPGMIFQVSKIEGRYPQWQEIIPVETPLTLDMERADLLQALKDITNKKKLKLYLSRSEGENVVALNTRSNMGHEGEASGSWTFPTTPGPALLGCVDLEYFLDIVDLHQDPTITLGISSVTKGDKPNRMDGPIGVRSHLRQHVLMPKSYE